MYIEGILLAAGLSVRMGQDKLSLPFRGKTVFEWSLSALINCKSLEKVIVVAGRDFHFSENESFTLVINEKQDEGMSSSFRKGIENTSSDADAFLFAFADMPLITDKFCEQLINTYKTSGKKILVPRYKNQNGHPVIFSSDFREDLLKVKGDIGGREIIKKNMPLVEFFETQNPAVILDIDTKEDYFEKNTY